MHRSSREVHGLVIMIMIIISCIICFSTNCYYYELLLLLWVVVYYVFTMTFSYMCTRIINALAQLMLRCAARGSQA